MEIMASAVSNFNNKADLLIESGQVRATISQHTVGTQVSFHVLLMSTGFFQAQRCHPTAQRLAFRSTGISKLSTLCVHCDGLISYPTFPHVLCLLE